LRATPQTGKAGMASMPTYVTLFQWTDQGVRDVKNAPTRFEAAKT